MRILYVEDNLANLALVQRLARIGNHEIISHPDGEAALAHFQQDKPDLILMDIQLKGALNGLDVVKKLREQGHKTPIIAVTAYAMLGDRERCLQAGCDEYLPKPLPVEQLVEFFERFDPKRAVQSVPQTAATGDCTEKQSTITASLPPAERAITTTGVGQVTAAVPVTTHDPVANSNPNHAIPEIRPGAATNVEDAPMSQPTPNSTGTPITVANADEPTPENTGRSAETGAASREPPTASESNTTPG